MNHFKSVVSHSVWMFLMAILLSVALPVYAHETGAPFSSAIVEPMRVHHAHIEDEQRVNLSFKNGFKAEDGEKRSAFHTVLELAVDWTGEFRIGSEILIPFSNTGLDRGNYGFGDIEIQPIKYAFISKPETIVAGALSIELPTGSEKKGLGEGHSAIGAILLLDHAYRNWFFGFNAEVGTSLSGGHSTGLEVATAISYSFIDETGTGMAPSKPNQRYVSSVSLELIAEVPLDSEEGGHGDHHVTLLPSVGLWHPVSEWYTRLGVELPVSHDRENDFAILFHVGNHFDWKKLLK